MRKARLENLEYSVEKGFGNADETLYLALSICKRTNYYRLINSLYHVIQ